MEKGFFGIVPRSNVDFEDFHDGSCEVEEEDYSKFFPLFEFEEEE